MEKCPHCNHENSIDAVYCTNCDQPTNKNIPTAEDKSGSPLDIFVGKKHEYYNKKWERAQQKNGTSFNVAAFFFSFLWLGYRKVYKPIILFSLGFLLVDVVLYLIGYEYSITSFSNPIDQGISIGVTVTFAMFGNKIYKDHAEKKIKSINESTDNDTEREKLYVKKGGTSWLGVLLAILIIAFIYIIPSLFIPMNTNSIEEVQQSVIAYTELEEEYEIKAIDMFDIIFDDGKWDYTDKNEMGKGYVTYTGKYNEAGTTNDISISFVVDDSDYIEIIGFSEDEEEWHFDDQLEVIDYLLFLLD